MAYFLKVARQGFRLFPEADAPSLGGGDPLRLALVAFHFAFLLCHLGEQVRDKQPQQFLAVGGV